MVTIVAGGVIGAIIGPPLSSAMAWLGEAIKVATELQPFLMGIVISAVMGVVLTLPISSAALSIILGAFRPSGRGSDDWLLYADGWFCNRQFSGKQMGRASRSGNRYVYAPGTQYCEKSSYLDTGYFSQRYFRPLRNRCVQNGE